MAKLGTTGHPGIMHVRTMERAQEIIALCAEHDWKVIVGVEADKPEDITDLYRLQGANDTANVLPDVPKALPVARNAPCPCGSGKKYKACCMEKVG